MTKVKTYMNSLDRILNKFKEKEGVEFYGALNDASIYEMESELKITFPESYKTFLKKYGYLEWFGHAIYGYSYDADYHTVMSTIELREDEVLIDFKSVSKNGCVLENYSGGGYYFLFSRESDRSGEVALFLDELFGNEAQSWATFEDFLNYMLSL